LPIAHRLGRGLEINRLPGRAAMNPAQQPDVGKLVRRKIPIV
jgi:hypothetical protein